MHIESSCSFSLIGCTQYHVTKYDLFIGLPGSLFYLLYLPLSLAFLCMSCDQIRSFYWLLAYLDPFIHLMSPQGKYLNFSLSLAASLCHVTRYDLFIGYWLTWISFSSFISPQGSPCSPHSHWLPPSVTRPDTTY